MSFGMMRILSPLVCRLFLREHRDVRFDMS